MTSAALPEGWEWRTLGGESGLAIVNPRRPRLDRSDDAPTSFLPMQGVDEVEGKIAQLEVRRFEEVRSGYTYFEENDVLFAKITPSMQNGKSATAGGLIDGIGFGSTEFHVLRHKRGVLPEWLHLFVRQLSFRREAMQHFRGAVGQQRVPQEFLETHAIPIPYPDDPVRSLAAQRRIVARIESLFAELREARRLHEEVVADTDGLIDAVLEETFDQVDTFHVEPLGGRLSNRITKGESPGWQGFDYTNKGPIFIRSENVLWGRLYLSTVNRIPREFHEKLKRSQLRAGDVLINLVGASIGRAAVVPQGIGDANINQAVAVVSPNTDHLLSEFLMYYVISPPGQRIIHGGKVEAARANISLGDLKELPVPLPPKEEQLQTVAYLENVLKEIAEMRKIQADDSSLLEQMAQAILAQAFRGEL